MRQRDLEAASEVPGAGWADGKPDRKRLLSIHELPTWYQPLSPYVRTGYRPPGLSLCACAATIGDVHNETGNIWTHLLGGFAWVAVSLRALRSPDLAVRVDDFTYYLHAVSYGLCGLMPLLSTGAHTFHCLGPSAYTSWWDADHAGILALWLARSLCEGYVLLYCWRGAWLVWAGLSVVVFALSAAEVVRSKSTALFLPLYAFIHLPILAAVTFDADFWPPVGTTASHRAASSSSSSSASSFPGGGGFGGGDSRGGVGPIEWLSAEDAVGANLRADLGEALRSNVALTLAGSMCGVLGYAVMVAKVPERWAARSGRFDTWGHSHQWWHALTILGPCLCLEAGRGLLAARLAHACPA